MRSLIFANGKYDRSRQEHSPEPDDLLIAADGGSRHFQKLGLVPDLVIGDLDSADPGLISAWERNGVEVIRYPEDKDQTDLEIALLAAQERGARKILVFGAVGGRLDMTFGNLTLLAHPDLIVPTTLVCGPEEIQLLKAGEERMLNGNPGDLVSLIPLQPGGSRISASGVAYPLDNEDLVFGTTRGISNQLVETQALIKLETGLLAVVHTRNAATEEEIF